MLSKSTNIELVSIVIPTYNRVSLLKKAIDSALDQTYQNIEVIIVDDSSSNDTEELCKTYGDKIRYFRRGSKGGMASAYNLGIKQMHGTWFKPLSDDNILAPDFAEVMVNYAHRTGAHILYSDYEFIDADGNQIGTHVEHDYSSYYEFANALWGHHVGNFESSLIRRSSLNIVGEFDSSYGSALDYDWWLRACLVHGYVFFHIPKPLLKFRVHAEQASWRSYADAQMVNTLRKRAEKIRAKVQKQMIEVNPEKWDSFRMYQEKIDNPFRQGFLVGSRSAIKKTYKHLPYGLRNYLRRLWYKRMRSLREVTCAVCKIYNRQSLLYLGSDINSVTCHNCSTYYNSENLKRLISA